MELPMNQTQTIFTVIFAIMFGSVMNVLPRWKLFNWDFHFWKARIRCVLGHLVLNLLPWLLFAWVFLQQSKIKIAGDLTSLPTILFCAILPGFIPLGCYKVLLLIIQFRPNWFFAENNKDESLLKAFERSQVPAPDQEVRENPVEPTIYSLYLGKGRLMRYQLVSAIVYLLVPVIILLRL